jgi:hypothetical protein
VPSRVPERKIVGVTKVAVALLDVLICCLRKELEKCEAVVLVNHVREHQRRHLLKLCPVFEKAHELDTLSRSQRVSLHEVTQCL